MNCITRSCRLMGSSFELGVVHTDVTRANELLDAGIAEIQRIEDLLTEFDPSSATSAINTNAGKTATDVDDETFTLFKRCEGISRLTQGYFDISVGPLKKLYSFKNDLFEMPEKSRIRKTLNRVGYRHIICDEKERTVFLRKEGMHVSFAAIGKGYAADRVKTLWQDMNVPGGYINASGDLTAFGLNEKGQPWKIGIADPDTPNHVLFYVPIENGSVATSGDYEQHFVYKGQRYSHNINPKTGMPLLHIKSVSVFSPSAELSDALATAVYAMGVQKGISFLDQLPQTHGIIIDNNNKVHFSKQLRYEAVS